jgi:hypothetical protein
MRYIEEGVDLDGNSCWFILDDAELVDIYNTQQEAENNL